MEPQLNAVLKLVETWQMEEDVWFLHFLSSSGQECTADSEQYCYCPQLFFLNI